MNNYASNVALSTLNSHHRPHNVTLATQRFQHPSQTTQCNTGHSTPITNHTEYHRPLNTLNIHHRPHWVSHATQHFQHPSQTTQSITCHSTLWTSITDHIEYHTPLNTLNIHHRPHRVSHTTQHSEHPSQTTAVEKKDRSRATPDRWGNSILDCHHAGHVLGFAKTFQHKVSIHQAMNAALHGTRCICDKAGSDALCSYHNMPTTVHSGYTEGKDKKSLWLFGWHNKLSIMSSLDKWLFF